MNALAVTLIVLGALIVIDAGLTLVWQEPISALYAKLRQDHLSGALKRIERAPPTPAERRALAGVSDQSARIALLAGGHVGVVAAMLWSLALGCAAVALLLALTPVALPEVPGPDERVEITIRGPLSYAGPGSLGGTESALRR